jgi:hypothetical protein
MSIRVRVLGDLRRFIPAEITEIDGSGWSVGTALEELMRANPKLRDSILDAKGRMHYAIVLRVGGRPVNWPYDKDVPIEDGGELLLTRFHSGG